MPDNYWYYILITYIASVSWLFYEFLKFEKIISAVILSLILGAVAPLSTHVTFLYIQIRLGL